MLDFDDFSELQKVEPEEDKMSKQQLEQIYLKNKGKSKGSEFDQIYNFNQAMKAQENTEPKQPANPEIPENCNLLNENKVSFKSVPMKLTLLSGAVHLVFLATLLLSEQISLEAAVAGACVQLLALLLHPLHYRHGLSLPILRKRSTLILVHILALLLADLVLFVISFGCRHFYWVLILAVGGDLGLLTRLNRIYRIQKEMDATVAEEGAEASGDFGDSLAA